MFRRKKQPTLARMVELLTVTPADRLVVTCSERVSQDAMAHIQSAVAAFAEIDPKRVLVVTNARVSVLREGEAPPPAVAAFPATEARGI